ncbi:MAG: hypothetical protein IT385_13790 [Deltaproteobacteria bacterium]|nr:hypothetical protein [Deltaproteobacteria bacterium]
MTLIGRVADASSIGAWVDRAETRTFVHLREEVEAAGLLTRVSREAGWLAPPDDDTLAEVQRFESAVLAGEVDVQMSVALARSGRVPVRVSVSSDVVRAWAPEPLERPFEGVYRRDRYRCQSPTCDLGGVLTVTGRERAG